jgi:hypothetical protein
MLWLAVSPDRYELPYAVEDSRESLAKLFHVSEDELFKATNNYRIITVEVEDDGE